MDQGIIICDKLSEIKIEKIRPLMERYNAKTVMELVKKLSKKMRYDKKSKMNGQEDHISLYSYPEDTRTLSLIYKNLSKIPDLSRFKSLILLDLSNNQISEIENIPPSIDGLYLTNNEINRIENIPNSVEELYLLNNQISKIENIPNSVQELYLSNNQISKIENIPNSVQELYLSNNQISKIENIPNSVQDLELGKNKITRIENIPNSVDALDLSENEITRIENIPNSLRILDIQKNNINRLENIPNSVVKLYISKNKINRIKNIPNSVAYLDLSENEITRIENIPNSVVNLDLSDNKISKIENIPDSVEKLDVRSNQITRIENIPNSVKMLYIFENPIEYIDPVLVDRYLNGYLKVDDSILFKRLLRQQFLEKEKLKSAQRSEIDKQLAKETKEKQEKIPQAAKDCVNTQDLFTFDWESDNLPDLKLRFFDETGKLKKTECYSRSQFDGFTNGAAKFTPYNREGPEFIKLPYGGEYITNYKIYREYPNEMYFDIKELKKNVKMSGGNLADKIYRMELYEASPKEMGMGMKEEMGMEMGEEMRMEMGEEMGMEMGEEMGMEMGEEMGMEMGEEMGMEMGEEMGMDMDNYPEFVI